MAFKHGKKGRVKADGTIYKCTEWDGDDTTEAVNVTNTESNGVQEMDDEGGVEAMNGSITFLRETGQPPPTKGMHALELYEGGKNTTDAFAFNAFVHSIRRQNQVRSADPITYAAQYMSSGPITRPTT